MKVPYTDYKTSINAFIHNKWQESWTTCPNNKLFQIKPLLKEWQPGYRKSRKEEVILSRLRIGHTRLTHSFILKKEDPPECIPCQERYTVKHFMIECVDLAITRTNFYNVPSLKDLFEKVNVNTILDFLKEVGLYHKL